MVRHGYLNPAGPFGAAFAGGRMPEAGVAATILTSRA